MAVLPNTTCNSMSLTVITGVSSRSRQ